jgi:hypothetical protein
VSPKTTARHLVPLLLLLTSTACEDRTQQEPSPPPPPAQAAPPPPTPTQAPAPDLPAATALADHLVRDQRSVFSEPFGHEIIWTDKAILERTPAAPQAIQALMAESKPEDGPEEGAIAAMLPSLEAQRAKYSQATVVRSGIGEFDCSINANAITAQVNCHYVNYLEARYPAGRFSVRGDLEPILFMEGETARAALMPVRP